MKLKHGPQGQRTLVHCCITDSFNLTTLFFFVIQSTMVYILYIEYIRQIYLQSFDTVNTASICMKCNLGSF